MLGGLFALLAAATFGFNNAAIRRGVLTGTVFQALAITVPMGVPFLFVILLLTGQLHNLLTFPMSGYVWLAFAGILHFVWGRYCNYRATRAIGGNLAGPWQQANMILSLTLAIVLLGETLTPLKVLGIALIIGGVAATTKAARVAKAKADAERAAATEAAASDPDPAANASTEPVFQPRYAEGYTFALLSATGYGISPVVIRYGLEGLGPSYSVVGVFVSYFAAAVTVGLIILFSRQWGHIREMSSTSVRWFSLAGILVGTSQALRYAALSVAPVTVVAPIQATSSFFRIVFAWFINRQHEVFGIWILVSMFLSMFGVMTLSITTDMVVANVSLPEWVLSIIAWEWP